MATSTTNVLLAAVSGKIGGMFVVRQRNGKTVICKLPKPYEKPPTKRQLQNRDRFRKATEFAKAAILDPEKKKYYESRAKKGQSAFNVAFRDAFRGTVTEANLSTEGRTAGVKIMEKDRKVYHPQDPRRVKTLTVHLLHASGYEMEKGQAVYSVKREQWEYSFRDRITKAHFIKLELEDLFGDGKHWLFSLAEGKPVLIHGAAG